MWSEDIICSLISYLPHEPALIDAFMGLGPRASFLVQTSNDVPKCLVSLEGDAITAIPQTHPDAPFVTDRFGAGGLATRERIIEVDGLGRVAGKEPFEKLLTEAKQIRLSRGVETRVRSLRLSYCRRLLPQSIPRSFITELCSGSLQTLIIEGSPHKAVDELIAQIVVACGSTLETIRLSRDVGVYISPATVGQIAMRCVSLRHLSLPTSSSFVACAVAKLMEVHQRLHSIEWLGCDLNILPAIARNCCALRSFATPTLLWRSRDTLALVKLIMANNLGTLEELAVDCGGRTTETGKYVANLMTKPRESHHTVESKSGSNSADAESEFNRWQPTALALRLTRLVFQEGQGIAAGHSALCYFSKCQNLVHLDVSVDTLASLAMLPTNASLRTLRVSTNPGVLSPALLLESRRRFEAFLLRQSSSLESVSLELHAAYPELITTCFASMCRLRSLRLALSCADYRSPSNVESSFTDDVIRVFAASPGGKNLEELVLHGFADTRTVITDESVRCLVKYCRRLRHLELTDLGGLLTDESLQAFHNHPDLTVRPLFCLSGLALTGLNNIFSFDCAAQMVRRVGGALTDLRLGRLKAKASHLSASQGIHSSPSPAAPASFISPPFVPTPSPSPPFPVESVGGDGEQEDAEGYSRFLSCCGHHCSNLLSLNVSGFRTLRPDAASLLEFRKGCRLATIVSM